MAPARALALHTIPRPHPQQLVGILHQHYITTIYYLLEIQGMAETFWECLMFER